MHVHNFRQQWANTEQELQELQKAIPPQVPGGSSELNEAVNYLKLSQFRWTGSRKARARHPRARCVGRISSERSKKTAPSPQVACQDTTSQEHCIPFHPPTAGVIAECDN